MSWFIFKPNLIRNLLVWIFIREEIPLNRGSLKLQHIHIPEFLASIKNDDVACFGIKTVTMWGENGKLIILKLNNICCVYVYNISIFFTKNAHT